jgi:hypothetical protein
MEGGTITNRPGERKPISPREANSSKGHLTRPGDLWRAGSAVPDRVRCHFFRPRGTALWRPKPMQFLHLGLAGECGATFLTRTSPLVRPAKGFIHLLGLTVPRDRMTTSIPEGSRGRCIEENLTRGFQAPPQPPRGKFSPQPTGLSTKNAVNECVCVSPCPGWKSGTIVYALYHTLGPETAAGERTKNQRELGVTAGEMPAIYPIIL